MIKQDNFNNDKIIIKSNISNCRSKIIIAMINKKMHNSQF